MRDMDLTITPTIVNWEIRTKSQDAGSIRRLGIRVKFGWLRTSTFWRCEPEARMSSPGVGWRWAEEVPPDNKMQAAAALLNMVPPTKPISEADNLAPLLCDLVAVHPDLGGIAHLFGIIPEAIDTAWWEPDVEDAIQALITSGEHSLKALRDARDRDNKAPSNRTITRRTVEHENAANLGRKAIGQREP